MKNQQFHKIFCKCNIKYFSVAKKIVKIVVKSFILPDILWQQNMSLLAVMWAQMDHNLEGFWHNKYKLNGRPLAWAAIGIESQSQEENKRFQDGA